ncbi:MAG: hypothetical protein JNK37_16145 [Verrucomicrobiales bacterium]|nr:hypothetical protein [Verrucomicrobiales bacterium]
MLRFRSSSYLHRHFGYTLVEVTLVLAVLLSLVGILFIGTQAYLKGADRAVCLQNLASVQKAVRAYGNLHQLVPGNAVDNLKGEIFGSDKFIPIEPRCPANGVYTFRGNILPQVGELYMSCSEEGHSPKNHAAW